MRDDVGISVYWWWDGSLGWGLLVRSLVDFCWVGCLPWLVWCFSEASPEKEFFSF